MSVEVRFYIDPSFSSTGITCILFKDKRPKLIKFGLVKTAPHHKNNYAIYLERAKLQAQQILEFCREFEFDCDSVFGYDRGYGYLGRTHRGTFYIEVPPAFKGFTTAPLWGLSFTVVQKLLGSGCYAGKIIQPFEVQRFCDKRGVPKKNKRSRWKLGILYLEALKFLYQDLRVDGEDLFKSGKQDDTATSWLFFVMHKLGLCKVVDL